MVNLHEALLSPGGKSSYSAYSNGALCLGLMGDLQHPMIVSHENQSSAILHHLVHLNFNLVGQSCGLWEVVSEVRSSSCVACMASHKKQLLGPTFSELDHVTYAVYTITYPVQSMNPLYLLFTIYLN